MNARICMGKRVLGITTIEIKVRINKKEKIMAREMINDGKLDQVVGGFMHFNANNNVLTYTNEDTGEVTTYDIDDFDNAWTVSANLHGQNIHEDRIIAILLSKGYIS